MPCTTLLVGRNASYDGSTLVARNDDSGSGHFVPKRMDVMQPEKQPGVYKSVISGVSIPLPEKPVRYTMIPNANLEREGIWAGAGINAHNVAMTATETITSNALVLAADPLCFVKEGENKKPKARGIGEEDLLVLTLPYIRTAREGVLRVGSLLEKYGTYEMNGMAFQDEGEIWWLETIGGHHWIAKRVPDDAYVVVPNQFSIDEFDMEDALHEGKMHLCSADMKTFVEQNHLGGCRKDVFHARDAFGSHNDHDHLYNTSRTWYVQKYFNPGFMQAEQGETFAGSDFGPESDSLKWACIPEKKITIEDIKYVLSSHYQGTTYDPYNAHNKDGERGKYRPIGINRNDFFALTQIRPYKSACLKAVEWITFGSNTFNAILPLYPHVDEVPEYLTNTDDQQVSTDSFYWANRLIAAIADAQYHACLPHIQLYQQTVLMRGLQHILDTDKRVEQIIGKNMVEAEEKKDSLAVFTEANERMAAELKKLTQEVLGRVLFETSLRMTNSYALNDK